MYICLIYLFSHCVLFTFFYVSLYVGLMSVCCLHVCYVMSNYTVYLFCLFILLYMLDLGIYGQSTPYTTGGVTKVWLNKAPSKVSCPHAT